MGKNINYSYFDMINTFKECYKNIDEIVDPLYYMKDRSINIEFEYSSLVAKAN